MYEFGWNGAEGTWERLKIHGREVGEFAIADVRGDGTPRLYVNEWGRRLFELSWVDGAWIPIQVAGDALRFYLTAGRLRSDNRSRLYASAKGRGVYEYTWTGAEYAGSVDAITSATGRPTIGDGRDDGKNRLYVGHGDQSPFPAAIAEVSDPNPPDSDLARRFLRGDAGADGEIDIGDAIFTLNHLFASGPAPPCLDSADANDDGAENLADAVVVLAHLFADGGYPRVRELRTLRPGASRVEIVKDVHDVARRAADFPASGVSGADFPDPTSWRGPASEGQVDKAAGRSDR
ncbi:MAG: hypothetical protein JXP34_15590 [Planctomycetes bacterium]|nr:hypothetical protein [Planctomycetota bacterium]